MDRFFRVVLLLTIVAVLGVPTPSFPWPIPDTGQTKCYNDTTEIPCAKPGEDFYGQDGNYLINAPSYTKLDENGNDLADTATEWVMVRDNVTGLIWEVKTDDGSLHDKDNQYTWYDSDPETNGGNAGTPGDGTDTEDFINALNTSEFGGFSDWRLPTIKELASIAALGRHDPAVNTNYFSNTELSNYWSSTTYTMIKDGAWYVSFQDGGAYMDYKPSKHYVRAVRGGQSRLLDHLILNGDETVTDTATGLMWQQDTGGPMSLKEALAYCAKITLVGGYGDWRLPNKRELRSIIDYTEDHPAVNTNYFPNTELSYYWSSTTYASATNYTRVVSFCDGHDLYLPKGGGYYVRAVRGGQSRFLGHLFVSAPHQGSGWKDGDQMALVWATESISGNVRISISRQGGKAGTFVIIEESTENDGAYNWTVSGPVSVNCVFKIEPLTDLSKGTTQGLFTIYGTPTVSTGPASSLSSESATLNGTVNPSCARTTAIFEWGTDTNYGNEVSGTQSPLTGDKDQDVSAELTGLSPGTTYHFRLKATNSADTAYGEDQVFTTNAVAPTVTTAPVTIIGANTAECGGGITSDGGDDVSEKGFCWSTSPSPTINLPTKTNEGSGPGAFFSSINELTPGTTYYVRAYATNTAGTAYGNQVEFKTKVVLTMAASPAASGGTMPAVGSTKDVDADMAQDISATANGVYHFVNWTADPAGNAAFGNAASASTTVTLTGSATVTANFASNAYTLTTAVNPASGGTVTKNPDKANYDHGEGVEVTANASAGYTFTGWTGDLAGTDNPANLTMDGDKNVTANFASTYTVTYNGNGNTSGAPPVDGNRYQQGDQVTVLANTGELVKTGYTFNNWNTAVGGGGTSYAPGTKFNMAATNVTLYAQWTEGSKRYVCSDGICGDNTPCHETILEAVQAASAGTLILIAAEEQDGNFSLDADKDLTLQGGWDKTFNDPNGGVTTLHGAPKAPQGSLTFQNLSIVP